MNPWSLQAFLATLEVWHGELSCKMKTPASHFSILFLWIASRNFCNIVAYACPINVLPFRKKSLVAHPCSPRKLASWPSYSSVSVLVFRGYLHQERATVLLVCQLEDHSDRHRSHPQSQFVLERNRGLGCEDKDSPSMHLCEMYAKCEIMLNFTQLALPTN